MTIALQSREAWSKRTRSEKVYCESGFHVQGEVRLWLKGPSSGNGGLTQQWQQAGRSIRRGNMGKFFAVTIFVIAIVSAVPILRHTWWMAEDISTHGAPIDEQMSETMAEAGISFVASQLILGFFNLCYRPAR